MAKRLPCIKHSIDSFRQRLHEDWLWFPLPAFISFGLLVVLTSQLLPGLNPRLGNPARLLEFDAQPEHEGSIWMSISLDSRNNQLVISTSDRKVFRFSSDVRTMEDFAPLVETLQHQVHERLASAALARHLTTIEITAVLAVDERVKFGLIRPVINALALAGITDYAFETVQKKEL